jgi:hypothetical protein
MRKPAPIKPEKIENPDLTVEERTARNSDIQMLTDMARNRDKPHMELDGMTYLEYYESNRKKDLAYLPPKKNKEDVRITSGVTREKDTTLLATLLNFNFVPDITAFNPDDTIEQGLGDSMSNLLKKSREIEDWEMRKRIMYREFVAQGDVFILDLHTEEFAKQPLNKPTWDPTNSSISDYNVQTRVKKVFSGCKAKMITGTKVYLGSVRVEHMEDQDAGAIVNVYKRSTAWAKYGTWERWENVPTTRDSLTLGEAQGIYKTWNMVECQEDEVVEIMLFDKVNNRFQIYLNGVPMLPHTYLLTNISPSGDIPMAQGKNEPISDFAYSKGQPSKTRIDEEVYDESLKLMILGMRQGRKPPMGSRNKKVYSQNVFAPGTITPDMRDGELFSILQNPGLNAADFSFHQLIKQGIDEKSVNTSYEGTDPKGDPTATQIVQEKEQQMLKFGQSIDGIVALERRLSWLRIYNILTHWTKKYDADMDTVQEAVYGKYRSFSVDTSLENGQKGMKMYRFTTDEYPSKREVLKEEKQLTEKYQKQVRIVYLQPDMLRKMKYTWFILVNPTPKNNDVLSQVLFVQNMRQGFEMFGPEAFNLEYVKQRWSVLINEDFSKLFRKVDAVQQMQQMMQAGGDRTGMAGGMQSAAGVRNKPLKAGVT